MPVSRARIRTAIATLLATAPGLTAIYGYEPDLDTAALNGATYVVIHLFDYTEKVLAGSVISEQQRTVILHLVQQTQPADPHDNNNREALQAQIDTVRDATETVCRHQRSLQDGQGMVAFDFKIAGATDVSVNFGTDRTTVDTWITLALRVQQ